MGFHTRHLSEDGLIASYETGGVQKVLNLFRAEAIVTSDSFSSAITQAVSEFASHRDQEKLENTLIQKFEQC